MGNAPGVGEAEIISIDNPPTSASDVTQVARLLLLIKENQLSTAVILFFAWQAGIFVEAWVTIQGVCNA